MKINYKKKFMPDFDNIVSDFQNIIELANCQWVDSFVITEMKRDIGGLMWCSVNECEIWDSKEECGKNNCNDYEPNGKAKMCKYKYPTYIETKNKWRIKIEDNINIIEI